MDVGADAVRAVVLCSRLGGAAEVERLEEVVLPVGEDGAEPAASAVAEALGTLRARLPKGLDPFAAAIPGDLATLRRLSFPRAALRQAEAAIRLELEGQLPFEVGDALLDHLSLSPPDREPAEILAILAPAEPVRDAVERLAAAGMDPASLSVGAAPLAHLLPPKDPRWSGPEAVGILDVGRLRSELVILRNRRPVFFRSFRHAGEDVTRALATAFRWSRGDAERTKQVEGALPEGGGTVNARRTAVSAEASKGAARLAGAVRRTVLELQGRGDGGDAPARIALAGGGSLLPGLAEMLSGKLGLPVEPLERVMTAPKGFAPPAPAAWARALGLALEPGASRARRIDLRKGGLRYRGDAAALRTRFRGLAAGLLLVLVAWIFFAWARARTLDREADLQQQALGRVTLQVMGRKMTDFDRVRSILEKDAKEIEGPMPAADALDIVAELARAVPSDIRHTITRLRIEPGKLGMNGTTRNADEAAQIPLVLKAFRRCVRDVGTLSGSGSQGNYSYEIEATTRCP